MINVIICGLISGSCILAGNCVAISWSQPLTCSTTTQFRCLHNITPYLFTLYVMIRSLNSSYSHLLLSPPLDLGPCSSWCYRSGTSIRRRRPWAITLPGWQAGDGRWTEDWLFQMFGDNVQPTLLNLKIKLVWCQDDQPCPTLRWFQGLQDDWKDGCGSMFSTYRQTSL